MSGLDSKSVRLSVSGLLLETGVTVEGAGWELVDKIASLLLLWFMDDLIISMTVFGRRNSIGDLRDIGHNPAAKTPAPM
jgi:hypothetical protein